MKTLLLNASPHANGDTAALIRAFTCALNGEIERFDCFSANLSPCIDCRRCHRVPGCAIDDDMQRVFRAIEASDAIVLASPVWFSLPTPPALALGSRLETYYCAVFRGEPPLPRNRVGGVLLVGGGSGGFDSALTSAKRLLRAAGAGSFGPAAISRHTDTVPAKDDVQALQDAVALAEYLNRTCESAN